MDNSCKYKVTLKRVRLNSGGYDAQGVYYGTGAPLYWAWNNDGSLDVTFRAHNREAAKEHVRSMLSSARFYR